MQESIFVGRVERKGAHLRTVLEGVVLERGIGATEHIEPDAAATQIGVCASYTDSHSDNPENWPSCVTKIANQMYVLDKSCHTFICYGNVIAWRNASEVCSLRVL